MTKNEQTLWTEAYKFYDKWKDMTGTREEWDACAEEALKICDKGREVGHERLAAGLLVAVYEWIEYRVKNERTA